MSLSSRDPVLLVEDNIKWAQIVQDGLQKEGLFSVELSHTKFDGYKLGVEKKHVFQAAIIDLQLDRRETRLEGLDLIRDLQDADCRYPIIVLSAHYGASVRVKAHEMGAINFLRRPIDNREVFFAELAAALMAAVYQYRRTTQDGEICDHEGSMNPPHLKPLKRGPLTLQLDGRFFVGTTELELTPTERRILTVLILSPSYVLIDDIRAQADYWGQNMHNIVSRSRRKLQSIMGQELSRGKGDLKENGLHFDVNPIEHDSERGYRISWPRSEH